MVTMLAFIGALAILIAVHEYGHYRMAVACGVRVLRFSVGFGPVLLKWRSVATGTEFVLCIVPLGGYVRMLDEREAPVSASDKHMAFNAQPLARRAAIVAAGPIANLLLAVFLYSVVHWAGVEQAQPILAAPTTGSMAEHAGLKSGDRVQQVGFAGKDMLPVATFEELRWLFMQGGLDAKDLRLLVQDADAQSPREVLLPLSSLGVQDPGTESMGKLGVNGPWTRPEIGATVSGGPADRAGLQEGDVVIAVDEQPVLDGQQLRRLIRSSLLNDRPQTRTWRVQREGQLIELEVVPELWMDAGVAVGRVGAYVGAAPAMLTVHHGFGEGLRLAAQRTWEISEASLRMMGRMLMGQASLQNLSGPLTIADVAGKSASLGWQSYLVFLALISVSLGVLNLLPIPVLDGGHLMYYLWESLTGREVSEAWLQGLQRVGLALVMVMMSIALYNDLARLMG
ncbi:MAG: hypothetical protein RLZZ591_1642 [Pseudomonadota bacterium]|jgi:regulator of sigma E protease